MSDTQPSNEKAKPRRWRRWLVEIALVVAVLLAVQWWQTRDVAYGPAPPLAGVLLDGSAMQLASERSRPVLVHFWAEWCPICRLEQGSIESLSKDYRVISVATTSGDAAAVRAYMRQEGLTFPTLVDEDGDVGRQWGVRGVPASFVIDADGQIAHATVGYTTGLGLRLRLWLAGR